FCSVHCSVASVFYMLSLHDALPIWLCDGSYVGSKWDLYVKTWRRLVRNNSKRTTIYGEFSGRSWSCRNGNHHTLDSGDFSRCIDERSEEHTSELQSRFDLVCRLLLEKKKRSSSRE